MMTDPVILFIVGVITVTMLIYVGVFLIINVSFNYFIDQYLATFMVISGIPNVVALKNLSVHGIISLGTFEFAPSTNTTDTFFLKIVFSTELNVLPTNVFVVENTLFTGTVPSVRDITREGFSIYFQNNLVANENYSYDISVTR